jgi:hypothetical protein
MHNKDVSNNFNLDWCKVPEGNMQSSSTIITKIVSRKKQNSKHNDNIDPKDDTFIILRENFTCLFEGETSNREELKYK